MLRKLKRYFADDFVSAEKDVGLTIASLLYDIASEEGIGVLNHGQVFLVYWFKQKNTNSWRQGGLDVSFGSPSPRLKDNGVDSCITINVENELSALFTPTSIKAAKKEGVTEFSDMCTFAVLSSFKNWQKTQFGKRITIFEIPSKQPIAFANSKLYRNAVLAGDESERARLVRDATEGRIKPQVFVQPALTIGHAGTIEQHLRDNDSNFDYVSVSVGIIR